MAYPTDLDNFTPKVDNVDDVNAVDVNELQTAIESLETKVGADSSAVATSHDYKITKLEVVVNNASSSAPASIDLHEDTDNGTNKINLTAPSAVASDKVLTLPDATDTLVGKDTTDTLTNKTLTAPVLNGALSGDAKATGATITTGTDDAKFVTPKALADATVGKLGAAWTNFTPAVASTVGTITTKSANGYFFKIGKTISFQVVVSITTNGTGSGAVICDLPATAARVGAAFPGRAVNISGKMVQAAITNTAYMTIWNYDNTYPAANGEAFYIAGTYEIA